MVDINFVEQLVESMNLAVLRLEQFVLEGEKSEVDKLKIFIFDLQRKVEEELGSNV